MQPLLSRPLRALLLLCAALLLAGCAKDIPRFTPPAERPVGAVDKPWPNNQFLALAYHDVEDTDPDQAYLSVRTDHLIEQIAWLREHGYQAVSVDQIITARDGGEPLPYRAVLLVFDDGYPASTTGCCRS